MSTPISVDDLRDKRDIAVQALKTIERRINETTKRLAMLEQERTQLSQQQQQAYAELLSTQAYVSGFNVALGEEPVPNAVATPLLEAQGLASVGRQS